MKWNKIEKSTWSRSEYYDHYHSHVPCSYSMTAKLDISALRERKLKLYPTMLFVLSKVVNCHEEFRTAINSHGELGFYDVVFPSYTIFHQQTETFSNIWTEYCGDYQEFLKRYQEDITCYGDREGFIAKPNMPENVFTVSMTVSYTHLDVYKRQGLFCSVIRGRQNVQWLAVFAEPPAQPGRSRAEGGDARDHPSFIAHLLHQPVKIKIGRVDSRIP